MNSMAKRVIVGVLGGVITLFGVVALVAEFAWAARLLRQAKNVANQAADAVKIKKRHRLMIVAALTFLSLVLLVFWYASTR